MASSPAAFTSTRVEPVACQRREVHRDAVRCGSATFTTNPTSAGVAPSRRTGRDRLLAADDTFAPSAWTGVSVTISALPDVPSAVL
jgi:hypothetical protein